MVLNYILVACPWSFQKHLIIHPKILDHGNCRNSTFWGAKSVKRFNWKELSKTVDCQLQSHWGETHEWIVQLFKNSLPRKTDFSVTLFLQTFDLYFNSVRSWSRAQCGGSITKAENINQGVLYVEEYRIDCPNKFCVPGATKKNHFGNNELTSNWLIQTQAASNVWSFFRFSKILVSARSNFSFCLRMSSAWSPLFLIFTLTTRDIDECCYSYSVHTQQ